MPDCFQIDQVAFSVNQLETLRNSVVLDGWNVPATASLSEFPSDHSLNQIRSVTFVQDSFTWESCSRAFASNFTYGDEIETNWIQPPWSVEYSNPACASLIEIQPGAAHIEYLSQDEYPNLLQPTVDWVVAPNGEVVTRTKIQSELAFDFCNELVRVADVFVAYVAESDRRAGDLLRRLYRKLILSSGVSKNGHLWLLASDRRVCIETAARDQVVHLEVITLAEEHEEVPSSSAWGQILMFGEVLCKRMKRSSWNLFSGCSEKALYFGSTSAGPSAVAA